uniref:Actin-interacting protein 1 n=1 Tax=Panagrolaimus superbus TaxID=310955 RepID=A0A914Y0N3_9BILA
MASNEYTLEKAFASLPRTVRGLPLVISGDPSGTKFLYCNGNNVYIREIDDPTKVEIYSEHAQLTTVAKYSPSGFYIASGDQSGKLRIWDTTQTTHILKAEYAFIAGAIRDIAWNDDSKRLAIVGEGRDRFGHVFLFDTGTSNGNLSGQSRVMTSIDFKPSRPYRLVSGSEDNTVAIFEGPPFKFKTLFHNHTRFVNSVRYNKDGSLFASAGADGKVFLCDGVEGEKKGELIDPSVKGGAAHAGGVFALAWNSDGSKVVSVSGDKTLKIWSAADQSLLKTVTFGSAIEDQQLAVTWQKETIVSIGLSGFIFYINPDSGEITKTIRGHNKPITALALSHDKKYAFTADFEGHITRWLIADGTSERLTPQIHKSQVASLAVTSKGTLVSIGWDDTVAFTAGVFEKVENIQANSQRLSSQPRGLDVSPDGSIAVVVCQREIVIFKNEKQAGTVNIKYEAQCGAYQCDGKYLAVGGSDNKVHVYSIQDVNLTEKEALPHGGCITSVSFSNDGKYLVATDNNRKVIPYKVDDNFSVASEKDWTYHNARVNCGAWSPNGRFVATGGLDTNVIVWDIQHSGESPIEIRGAHSSSAINGVAWLDDKRLLTVGQDSNIKIWSVNLS